nr:MAG TPA: hypothetical protein [Caudoviricetes sp.]
MTKAGKDAIIKTQIEGDGNSPEYGGNKNERDCHD